MKKKLKDALHRFKVETFKLSHQSQGENDVAREIFERDGKKWTEIARAEAAAALSKDAGIRLLGRIRDEQVLQLLSVRIEEPQIGEPGAGHHASSKWTTAYEQRNIDRKTTRAGPAGLHGTLVTKRCLRRRLLRGWRGRDDGEAC
jgi:hypothetical protein